MSDTRLTQISPGAGCGCKISPKDLEVILTTSTTFDSDKLIVGNSSKDDAAVFDMGNGRGVVSTTDFFTPIVDDPFDFGRISAVNAISDIYAMGGTPLMAIAILGWPLDKLPKETAQVVVEGARSICHAAGIPLAGGHSIDIGDPVFGLAVTGDVELKNLKRNDTAEAGCHLYLTKPLGVGAITTAQKRGKVTPEHLELALQSMTTLNRIGTEIAQIAGVTAMTDVTGFGLLGHLCEMCEGSGLQAELRLKDVPIIEGAMGYVRDDCIPGGTHRNRASYGHKIAGLTDDTFGILCDPQTSGGLLVAVEPQAEQQFLDLMQAHGKALTSMGQLMPHSGDDTPYISVVHS